VSIELVPSSASAEIDARDPTCVWFGNDRLGNVILITEGAFGMANRQHVWQRQRHELKASSSKWDLVADDRSEISGAGAIWHRFKCPAQETPRVPAEALKDNQALR
jgi:hypothetical protein